MGRLTARADARRAAWIAEAERTDAARKEGFSSTTAWLAALSGEPVPVCRSQIAVAEALEEMPETRKAFAAGEVSESRVKVLAQAQALAPSSSPKTRASLVAQVADGSCPAGPQGAGRLEDERPTRRLLRPRRNGSMDCGRCICPRTGPAWCTSAATWTLKAA